MHIGRKQKTIEKRWHENHYRPPPSGPRQRTQRRVGGENAPYSDTYCESLPNCSDWPSICLGLLRIRRVVRRSTGHLGVLSSQLSL
jgi:hypothetical protein